MWLPPVQWTSWARQCQVQPQKRCCLGTTSYLQGLTPIQPRFSAIPLLSLCCTWQGLGLLVWKTPTEHGEWNATILEGEGQPAGCLVNTNRAQLVEPNDFGRCRATSGACCAWCCSNNKIGYSLTSMAVEWTSWARLCQVQPKKRCCLGTSSYLQGLTPIHPRFLFLTAVHAAGQIIKSGTALPVWQLSDTTFTSLAVVWTSCMLQGCAFSYLLAIFKVCWFLLCIVHDCCWGNVIPLFSYTLCLTAVEAMT